MKCLSSETTSTLAVCNLHERRRIWQVLRCTALSAAPALHHIVLCGDISFTDLVLQPWPNSVNCTNVLLTAEQYDPLFSVEAQQELLLNLDLFSFSSASTYAQLMWCDAVVSFVNATWVLNNKLRYRGDAELLSLRNDNVFSWSYGLDLSGDVTWPEWWRYKYSLAYQYSMIQGHVVTVFLHVTPLNRISRIKTLTLSCVPMDSSRWQNEKPSAGNIKNSLFCPIQKEPDIIVC